MDMPVVFAIASVLMIGGSVAASAEEFGPAVGLAGRAAQSAHADLRDKDGNLKGHLTASAVSDGIHVVGDFEGVAPGTYAVHLHAIGSCTPPDFSSAGPHWNPESKQHGKDNPAGAHKGDMPNVIIGPDGKGRISAHILGSKLLEGAGALLDADGAAIVLHAGVDDYKTDPTGNAGGRAACGIFATSP